MAGFGGLKAMLWIFYAGTRGADEPGANTPIARAGYTNRRVEIHGEFRRNHRHCP
jgi:hypothetical protein